MSKWRLPTKDELNKMYENLYKKGIGGFADDLYWSSSEYDSNYAWSQYFANGFQLFYNKNLNERVRTVLTFVSSAITSENIGEIFLNGIIFDVQDNTVFVCKKEDEDEDYNWDEALKPMQIFSKIENTSQICNRIDDKLSRIKNGKELRKNDIADLFGYLALLMIDKNWLDFSDLID